jgi:F-BAR domain only protein
LQSGLRRNASTIRGRRDVRNTTFIAPSAAPEIPPAAVSAPLSATSLSEEPEALPAPVAAATLPQLPATPSQEDRAMSDTTSVHSSHALHTISGPVSHPELHEPGLNASIIETVNTWFESGNVIKSFVVGELALAYNATAGSTTSESKVRLDNFALLEKVAANPHFVTEISKADDDDKRGEYNVALEKIARSIPTVAFKYQLHLSSPDLSSYSPILFRPVWHIEESQASVIIFYSVNPAFVGNVASNSILLKNVVITVNLNLSPEDEATKQPREVVRATSAVMYPNAGAIFRRKQSAVVWRLPELEVRAGGEEKFLARFTSSASWPRQGKVEAKFEHHTTDSSSRLGLSVAESVAPAAEEHDPFADEDATTPAASTSTTWKEVQTARKLVAGKYVAS